MATLPPLGQGPLKTPSLVQTPVAGFKAGAATAGLRKDGRIDLALIAAEAPVSAAAVFTKNRLAAAPVQVARRHVAAGRAQAILANSGGANAATGQPGLAAAEACCRAAGAALGCDPGLVLPCSTGVIGQLLDSAKVAAVLPGLAAGLKPDGLARAAQAIMTTDAFAKMAEERVTLAGAEVTMVGMAKGAGMIHPDMATMLCFVLTDAAASPAALKQALTDAAAESFNRASVDGDTSTNDSLLLLASGRAGNPELGPQSPDLAAFTAALVRLCQRLAAMLVADGEGAEHLVLVRVTGAPDDAQALAHAFAIAHSPLCKTALAGCDPNWGRIVSTAGAEAGRRGWAYAMERLNLWIGEHQICRDGLYAGPAAEQGAAAVMKEPRYAIRLDLGLGAGESWVLTSDLGHEYVRINADYRT
ncbi:MAG: bifunctional glutamate N-acetyltransferase/amino-acid acetyltransferase ArgJ [Thermodesulfobacteriota bacterium]